MKKLLLMLFAVMALQPVQAQSFSYEKLKYNITSETTVEVDENEKAKGDINIPATVKHSSKTYSVTEIGSYAFYTSGIKSVTIPNSVTSIGKGAFAYCSKLTSVTIPNSVTSIGESAFQGVKGLISVTIPNSVTSIGESAFESCGGLKELHIGEKVSVIGEKAFGIFSELTKITVEARIPPRANDNSFTDKTYENAILYVPENSINYYKGVAPWNKFLNIKPIDETGEK